MFKEWLMIVAALMSNLFLVFTAVSGSLSAEKLHRHQSGITLNPFALGKGVTLGWISLL